jgi:TRAP-type C4-dicarboxylate transport system permease small subunit
LTVPEGAVRLDDVSDSVLGVILHALSLAFVFFIIWGGYVENRRANREYQERAAAK